MNRPALRLVNADTGEFVDPAECHECARLRDQIAGLDRDIRGWRARYAELARDLDQDARGHLMWDDVSGLVAHWRRVCRHPNSRMTADRFWLVVPFFKRHGEAMCKRAIEGAGFDPMTKQRKNGSVQRFDGLDLIFRSESHFESFCNRAPKQ